MTEEAIFATYNEQEHRELKRLGLPCVHIGSNGNKQWIDGCHGKTVFLLPIAATTVNSRLLHDIVLQLRGCRSKLLNIVCFKYGDESYNTLTSYLQAIGEDLAAQHYMNFILQGDKENPVVELEFPKPSIRDGVLTADAFMDMVIPEREHYLHPWLRDSSITLISAPRGVGKSMFAIGTLLAVAGGTEFGPWQSFKSVPCFYSDGEMAASDDKERLTMFQPQKGLPFHIYNDAHASSLGLPKSNMTSQKWRDDFKAMLLEMCIKLVCFDNIASLAPGLDENSKEAWDIINLWLIDLRFAGISSVLVHHMGKAGTQRGTSGREDNIDISISLVKPGDYTPEDGCRFIAQFTKHRLPQSDLSLIADTEFKLVQEGNHYTWSWGNVAKKSKKECLRLLVSGTEQKTIASILGVGKGTVSKWKAFFISKKLMTDKNMLTPTGELFLGCENA